MGPELGNLVVPLKMMKQKSLQKQKSFKPWKRRFFIMIVLSFCFGSLILMETQYSRIKMLPLVSHRHIQVPKIAFLFIARNRIPLDVVWDAFFQGHKDQFSIYVHSRPGFSLNKATTRSAYFYDRQLNDSIQVDWGEASMLEAERILLLAARSDPLNERFAFVSDSCIPLYNFSYTYSYIMSASTSFLDSFADRKEGRYNPRMHPVIPSQNWRKGSQWAVLIRKHAAVIVEDETIYQMFQRHCRRRSLPEFWREHAFPVDPSKEHNCIPDEHYVQTLLVQKGLEGEITRRSLTHTSWDLSSSKVRQRRGWHPATYKLSDATLRLIDNIKGIDNIYYETEYRREWCSSKGRPSSCFLFARKFTRPAALHLLNMVVLSRILWVKLLMHLFMSIGLWMELVATSLMYQRFFYLLSEFKGALTLLRDGLHMPVPVGTKQSAYFDPTIASFHEITARVKFLLL